LGGWGPGRFFPVTRVLRDNIRREVSAIRFQVTKGHIANGLAKRSVQEIEQLCGAIVQEYRRKPERDYIDSCDYMD